MRERERERERHIVDGIRGGFMADINDVMWKPPSNRKGYVGRT